jgi:aspartyl-tRNA(Asn)/glutamyl-tRNA(Gln) amidotransferase subunit A
MITVEPSSAGQIAEATRQRYVSCTEIVTTFLKRSERAHAATGCFVDIDARAALERAHVLDGLSESERRGRPLLGVPYAYKDVFEHDGNGPGIGESRPRPRLRATESSVLAKLDQAGAVPLGRLKLDPLGYAATGLNDQVGDTRNPWNLSRIAGGSSAGAAAAVAAHALPFAIGTDTGGSIRIPASLCGVVGLKPTYGRISRQGAAPLCYSQDTIGVLARSVGDVALVLEVLAGFDDLDPGSIDVPVPSYSPGDAATGGPTSLTGLRIGLDRGYVDRVADRDVSAAILSACQVLGDLGAEIVPVDLSTFAEYDAAATILTWSEAIAVHGRDFRRHRSEYSQSARARLDMALMAQGSAHVDAMRVQGRALTEVLGGVLEHCDLIATPAAGTTAPAINALKAGHADPIAVTVAFLELNRPHNFLGLPSMSLPMGFAPNGMPMGLQLAGRPWSEATIIRAGAAFQGATQWHLRSPSPPTEPERS